MTDTYWKLDNYNLGGTSTMGGTPLLDEYDAYMINYQTRSTHSYIKGQTFTKFWFPMSFIDKDIADVPQTGHHYWVGVAKNYSAYDIGLGYNNYSYGWSISQYDGSISDSNIQYIHITGGVDATDWYLIEELQAHATQCDSKWNPL